MTHVRTIELRVASEDAAAAPAVELSIAEAGVGGRPLLFLHGFTGGKEDFTLWFDDLAAMGWHAVAPDQRGHGASHKPDDESAYSFELFAADVFALLDALGWASAVVVGHSMGGVVLQIAVLQAPERFEALVLLGTSHRALSTNHQLVEAACSIATTQGMEALRDVLDAFGTESPVDSDIDRQLKDADPEYKVFGDAKLLASSPAMYAAMARRMTGIVPVADRLEDLRSIDVPVLVMVGEHDRAMRSASERMAAAIPGAELVVVPGAAHSPQFEAPAPCWAALSAFLERVHRHVAPTPAGAD